ncbi:putative caspase-like protein [Saccharothrix carnea]|uniref:Putative caspase-like protein n=1 Tax=Saccharothrix carnea TaxID=1280637 RepID=A0A2P8I5B3_SACCR|nr:caspase family protein [Saccharothrix carnea]PSL53645.1 putative caspase-like protein [Saccharothrix carnea]
MRRALLIATDTYRDPTFGALRAPRLDATELDMVLSDPAIGDFATEVLVNEPVQHLRERIETVLGQARHDDLVLLYLSGHGVKARLGDLHFVTTDTRHTVLATTSLDAAFVRRQIDDSLAGQVVVWLDCCYGGAFPSGMLPRATEDVDVVQQLVEGRGCAVMTASTHIQYAYEPVGDHVDDRAEPSVFTKAIIDGLRTGDADLDHDGEISALDLYRYVYDRVRRTNPDQTPTSSGTLSGDLRIAYAGTPLPPGLPDELRRLLRSPKAGFRRAGLRILRELAQEGDQVSLAALRVLEKSVSQVPPAARKTPPRPAAATAPPPGPITPPPLAVLADQPIRTVLRRSVPEFDANGVVGRANRRVVFSHDSSMLAAGKWVRSTQGWRAIFELTDGVFRAFSPDDRLVAVSSYQRLTVFSTETWTAVASVTVAGYVDRVGFNHDGTLLAVTSRGATKIFQSVGDRWQALDEPVFRDLRDVRFCPDTPRLLVATDDERIDLWNTTTWTRIGSTDLPGVRVVALKYGLLLAAASKKTVRVWRADTWEVVSSAELDESRFLGPVAFGPELNVLICRGWHGVELRSVADGKTSRTIPTDLQLPALSGNGRFLAGVSPYGPLWKENEVWVWVRDRVDAKGLRPKRIPPKPSVAADNKDRRRVGHIGAVGGGVVTASVLAIIEWAAVPVVGAGGVLAAVAWWVVDRVWIT